LRTISSEARAIAELRHPNIPPITAQFTEQGNYYLVTDYIEGESLQSVIDRMPRGLPEIEVRNIALQVLNALKYLASLPRPVIHSDIMPSSLVRRAADGVILVADFAVGRSLQPVPDESQPFAAPEQFGGRPVPESDIFSLGTTMHYLLTGINPRMKPANATARQLNPNVSVEMDALVTAMTQSDYQVRPSADRILQLLSGVRTTNTPTSVPIASPGISASRIQPAPMMPQGAPPVSSTPVQPMQPVQPLPLTFRTGQVVNTPPEFVGAAFHNLEEAAGFMASGQVEQWLRGIGQENLAQAAANARAAHRSDPKAAVTEFIGGLAPDLPKPVLQVNTMKLTFGNTPSGQVTQATLQVRNGGQSYLYGTITPRADWLDVRPTSIGCLPEQVQEFAVRLKSTRLQTPYANTPVLELQTNGGAPVLITADYFAPTTSTLEVLPKFIELPSVPEAQIGSMVQGQFSIVNQTGSPQTVQISAPDWVIPTPSAPEIQHGQTAVISLSANTSLIGQELAQSRASRAEITLQSAVGVQSIPVRVQVPEAWYSRGERLKLWGIYLGLLTAATAAWGFAATAVIRLVMFLIVALAGGYYQFYGSGAFLDHISIPLVFLAIGAAGIQYLVPPLLQARQGLLNKIEGFYDERTVTLPIDQSLNAALVTWRIPLMIFFGVVGGFVGISTGAKLFISIVQAIIGAGGGAAFAYFITADLRAPNNVKLRAEIPWRQIVPLIAYLAGIGVLSKGYYPQRVDLAMLFIIAVCSLTALVIQAPGLIELPLRVRRLSAYFAPALLIGLVTLSLLQVGSVIFVPTASFEFALLRGYSLTYTLFAAGYYNQWFFLFPALIAVGYIGVIVGHGFTQPRQLNPLHWLSQSIPVLLLTLVGVLPTILVRVVASILTRGDGELGVPITLGLLLIVHVAVFGGLFALIYNRTNSAADLVDRVRGLLAGILPASLPGPLGQVASLLTQMQIEDVQRWFTPQRIVIGGVCSFILGGLLGFSLIWAILLLVILLAISLLAPQRR